MLLHKSEHDTTEMSPPPPYAEDDYDVYLFYPSVSPRLLIPANGTDEPTLDTVHNLAKHHQQIDNVLPPYSWTSSLERVDANLQTVDELELEATGELLSPLSPTWFFVSEFGFPQNVAEDVLNVAGYSRASRDGLFSKSRQLTRRLGVVRRKLVQVAEFFKLKRKRSE